MCDERDTLDLDYDEGPRPEPISLERAITVLKDLGFSFVEPDKAKLCP